MSPTPAGLVGNGIIVNASMIFGLGWPNWTRLGVWLVIGLVIYFAYGRHHSKLAHEGT